jgi:hypothetical protein
VKRAWCMLSVVLVASACATTGASGRGDENLPTSGVGPFRKLADDEVLGVAPFVLDDKAGLYREPAVLADGAAAILYAVGRDGDRDVIVRSRADDARSFYGTSSDTGHRPVTVLAADAPWEGASLGGPFALRQGAEIVLYYAAAGGIGLARSSDGLAFRKEPAPVLGPDPSAAWETTAPSGPSAYVDAAGKTHLFYAAGPAIGEAVSDDGVHFVRAGFVLVPAAAPAPGTLAPNEKPPFDTVRVADPCVAPRVTPAGRVQVRVLYTGTGADGATTIGLAARYGDVGPLERAATPVYAVGQKESAPALLELGAEAFLYVGQQRSATGGGSYPAIAAAFAPGNVHLPTPTAFADSP